MKELDKQSLDKSAEGSSDYLYGMNDIAKFFGMKRQQAYLMAEQGFLPGVSKMGPRLWMLHKSVAREALKERASV